MQAIQSTSFMWSFFIMGAVVFVFGLRALIAWLAIRRDAAADYDYKFANGMVPDSLDREAYEAIYRRVYAPRGPMYVAGGMLAILVLTPVAMIAFSYGLNLLYNLSGQNRAIEPGYLAWQSFLFFGMIFVWVGIGYAVARRYHRTTPGSLQYEMDQHLYGENDLLDKHLNDGGDTDIKLYLGGALLSTLFAVFVYLARKLGFY